MSEGHSPLGASGAERWLACPASVRLSEGQPDQQSKYAFAGTMAHEIAAGALQDKSIAQMMIDNPEINTWVETLSEDEIAELEHAVNIYVEYVENLMAWGPGSVLHVEKTINLPFHKDLWGTLDAAVWQPHINTLHTIDFKYGKGVMVDVEGNGQLKYYALGACHVLGYNPRRLVTTIVQPRAGEPIRSCDIDPLELIEFGAELARGARETEKPDAAIVLGDHCRWCRAERVCPARIEQKAAKDFTAIIPV